jgi:hypothetical protein
MIIIFTWIADCYFHEWESRQELKKKQASTYVHCKHTYRYQPMSWKGSTILTYRYRRAATIIAEDNTSVLCSSSVQQIVILILPSFGSSSDESCCIPAPSPAPDGRPAPPHGHGQAHVVAHRSRRTAAQRAGWRWREKRGWGERRDGAAAVELFGRWRWGVEWGSGGVGRRQPPSPWRGSGAARRL